MDQWTSALLKNKAAIKSFVYRSYNQYVCKTNIAGTIIDQKYKNLPESFNL